MNTKSNYVSINVVKNGYTVRFDDHNAGKISEFLVYKNLADLIKNLPLILKLPEIDRKDK